MADTSITARELYKKWRIQNPEMSPEQAFLESQQAVSEHVPQEGDPTFEAPSAQFVGPELPADVAMTRGIDPRGKMSPAESFVAGGVNWSSGGLADEMLGVMSDPTLGSKYRTVRNSAREAGDAGWEQNPKSYATGAVIGGGALGATGPVAAGYKGAAGIGAAWGAAQGLASSEADLTKGEWGGAAADTAIGGALGAPLGMAARAVPGLARASKGKLRAGLDWARSIGDPEFRSSLTNQRVGAKAAEQVSLDSISGIGHKQSVGEKATRAGELESDVLAKTGENLSLRPSQSTGSPALIRKEAKAVNYDQIFDSAEAEASKQANVAVDYVDALVDDIAANPKKLGRSDVGEEVANTVLDATKAIVKERSAVTTPMIEEAMRLSKLTNPSFGDTPNLPIPETQKVFADIVKAGGKRLASPEATRLGSTYERYLNDPIITLDELQSALADWGDKAAPSGKIFKDIESFKDQRNAKLVRSALLKDLDGYIKLEGTKGDAGKLLVKFRDTYRAYSEQIDGLDTKIISKIIGAGEETPDAITTKLLSPATTPEEISFVMGVLNKSNPETAQQLQAQVIEDLLVKGGKPQRGMGETKRLGMNFFDYDKTARSIYDTAPKIEALLAGNKKAQLNFTKTRELLEHLRYEPKINQPQQKGLADAAGRLAGWKLIGAPSGAIQSAIDSVKRAFSNEKALAKALTTPEGIGSFNKALNVVIKYNSAVQAGRQVDWAKILPETLAQELTLAFTHEGTEAAPEIRAGARRLAQD